MRIIRVFLSIIAATFVLLTFGQACTQSTRFTSLNSLSSFKNEASGNGGTYDGKIRVLHHYVEDFTCEGRPQPESILMRSQEMKWTLIRNTFEKCAAVNRVQVTDVNYDEVINQAIYNNDLYVPPRDYFVIASEDPNLPGVNTDTGVCEDANGICSLHAAIDQASITSVTAPVLIHVPAGLYSITSSIVFSGDYASSKPITLRGENPSTTILDGTFSVAPLRINRRSYSKVTIENLTVQNGSAPNGTFAASAIDFSFFNLSPIDITNCIIKNNKNNVAIFSAYTSSLQIQKTIFTGNDQAAVRVFGAPTLIEDSTFDGNPDVGLWVSVQTQKVVVRRSTFSNNILAFSAIDCFYCSLENVTIANNQTGISIWTTGSHPGSDFTITNSTIVENNNGTGNLQLHFSNASNRLFFNNSVLATNDSTKSNCNWPFPNDVLTFKATNSLIDDSSCGVLDTTNVLASAGLNPLANNGGLTLTMLPLPSSPLINAGSDQLCPATDQRGVMRKSCDIGAVEAP